MHHSLQHPGCTVGSVDSPTSLVRAVVYANSLRTQLDAAQRTEASLKQQLDQTQREARQTRIERDMLADRLQHTIATIPQQTSRRRSPSAPRHGRGRKLGDDETSSIDTNDNDLDDDSAAFDVPEDAHHLLRDARVASLLQQASARRELRPLLGQLLVALAAGEKRRNAELEERKAQLQAAVQSAAAERCAHDCAERLSAFEKLRTGLQRQHADKLNDLIRQSLSEVRKAIVSAQKQRADSAELEQTRVATAADARVPATEARRAVRDEVSTLASEPARANRSVVSTLPEPSHVASSFASGVDAQHSRIANASVTVPADVTVASATTTAPPGGVTAAAVPAPQAPSPMLTVQTQHFAGRNASLNTSHRCTADCSCLYEEMELTRRVTASADADLQARLEEYQRQQVARANQSAAQRLRAGYTSHSRSVPNIQTAPMRR
jgi:hypothetical protein